VETKLGGMKIKETLEVGSLIVIIEAQLMFKTTKPMPMIQPNTGGLKLGHAGQYFFPNIYECGFYFPKERTLLSFYNANLFAKAQCDLLHKKKSLKGNFVLIKICGLFIEGPRMYALCTMYMFFCLSITITTIKEEEH
jgi:hypothetical protein